MRKYETFFIVDPELSDDHLAGVSDKFKGVVGDNGGFVLDYSPWGKKKLAYYVKKHSRGYFILMEYAGGSKLVSELERTMRLDERVLKFITVKLDEAFDPARDLEGKAKAQQVSSDEDESKETAQEPEVSVADKDEADKSEADKSEADKSEEDKSEEPSEKEEGDETEETHKEE